MKTKKFKSKRADYDRKADWALVIFDAKQGISFRPNSGVPRPGIIKRTMIRLFSCGLMRIHLIMEA